MDFLRAQLKIQEMIEKRENIVSVLNHCKHRIEYQVASEELDALETVRDLLTNED